MKIDSTTAVRRAVIAKEHPVYAGTTFANTIIARNRVLSDFQAASQVFFPAGLRLAEKSPVSHFCVSDLPLSIQEVGFYFVRGQKWDPLPNVRLPDFPFRHDHKEGAIVPLAGKIFIGQRELHDDDLRKVGLIPVTDDAGNKITFPFLSQSATRLIMDIFPQNIPLFGKIRETADEFGVLDKKYFPAFLESYEHLPFLIKYSGIPLNDLVEQTRQKIKKEWEYLAEHSNAVEYNIFFERNRLSAIAGVLVESLSKTGQAEMLKACCLQFKGVGSEYRGRTAALNQDGLPDLLEGEEIIHTNETNPEFGLGKRSIVCDPKLSGKFGIFLDKAHQSPPASPDPVGGMIKTDTEAIELDNQLFEAGAFMGAMTVSAVRIVEESAIRNILGFGSYKSGDLYALARAPFADTRRLRFLIERPELYPLFIWEMYGSNFKEGRERHLMELAFNLGRNMRAVLKCGRTQKNAELKGGRPNTADNLSTTGGIFDSTELRPARFWRETGAIISFWLDDYFDLAKSAGLSRETFFEAGRYFRPIFSGLSLSANGEMRPEAFEMFIRMKKNEAIYELTDNLLNLWSDIERG
ncbi:MAG: hypothetical protein HQ564_02655 [Candidatus Saganbacteria bacterium]|nr:hypothetical protein [Candidatus Saganbacteria bacterium]